MIHLNFPNYDTFSNVNVAYTDLVKKISNTIHSLYVLIMSSTRFRVNPHSIVA